MRAVNLLMGLFCLFGMLALFVPLAAVLEAGSVGVALVFVGLIGANGLVAGNRITCALVGRKCEQ